MNAIRNDPAEMERALNLLFEPRQVIEIRALHVKNGNYADTLSGYFDDFHKAAIEAAKITMAAGVYFTINQVDPALLARRCNRIAKLRKDDPTTADTNIVRRRFLPIDIDPARPSEVSATDDEHEAAICKVNEVSAWLKQRGWPEPIVIDSGNGAWARDPAGARSAGTGSIT